MIRLPIAALLASLLAGIACAESQPPTSQYSGNPDCRIFNPSPVANQSAVWSGGCKDGYADGPGFAQWSVNGKDTMRYEGPLVRGKRHGRGATQINDEVFSGEFRDNKRNGPGILAKEGVYTLSGNFVDDAPAGAVKVRFQSGDSYEGSWRDEAPDGEGTMLYATGGSYRGGWKEGKMHGRGVITYPNGIVREGEFADGIIAGGSPIPSPAQEYHLNRKVVQDPYPGPVARGSHIPFDKGYDALTPDQQRLVRSRFPILQDGDRPPYPLNGTEEIIRLIHGAHGQVLATGTLQMDVLIDETGAPLTATIRNTPNAELADFAGKALLLNKYTPGRCGGKPCKMSCPFTFALTVAE